MENGKLYMSIILRWLLGKHFFIDLTAFRYLTDPVRVKTGTSALQKNCHDLFKHEIKNHPMTSLKSLWCLNFEIKSNFPILF